MEDRKRRGSPAGGQTGTAAQKRKLSSMGMAITMNEPEDSSSETAAASAAVDASLGLEPGFLERFQKGAIHRQMLAYKRELDRTAEKMDRLELQYRQSTARLAAVEHSWERLLEELQAMLGGLPPEDSSNDDAEMTNGHTDDDKEPEQDPVVSKRLKQTRSLISGLMNHSSSSSITKPIPKDLSSRFQTVSAQLLESRTNHSLLESVLETTNAELQSTLEKLHQVERKLERERDATIQALEKRAHGENKENAPPAPAATAAAAGVASPAPPAAAAASEGANALDDETRDKLEGSSGLTRTEIEELQAAAERREGEIELLRTEKRALEQRTNDLRLQIRLVPQQIVQASDSYQHLEKQLSEALAELEDAKKATTTASGSASNGKESAAGEERERDARKYKELEAHSADLSKKLSVCMSDLARIRAERDARLAELAEAKAKDGEKVRHVDQMRTLAEARQGRIQSLVSEVYRLRLALAAEKGDHALVTDLARAAAQAAEPANNGEKPLPEEILLHEARQKVADAERQDEAFRQKLCDLTGLAEDDQEVELALVLVKAKEGADRERDEMKASLEQLQALLDSAGKPDEPKLRQKAEEAEKAVKALEAKVKDLSASNPMLYQELAKLSDTWEALNTQNQAKVFELAQYDQRLERLAVERTKAHQKYYAVEREKEALLAQIAIGEKLTKAQKAHLERAEEERLNLNEQLQKATAAMEQHEAARKEALELQRTAQKAAQVAEHHRASAEKRQAAEAKLLAERTGQVEHESAGKRRAEESVAKLERELEKWKKKAAAANAAAAGQGGGRSAVDDQDENVMLKRMLKCSSCQQRFKTHTITRCFHLFCKECIDARLDTRQRKCPSCSIGFGAQDVQQVYF